MVQFLHCGELPKTHFPLTLQSLITAKLLMFALRKRKIRMVRISPTSLFLETLVTYSTRTPLPSPQKARVPGVVTALAAERQRPAAFSAAPSHHSWLSCHRDPPSGVPSAAL